MVKELTDNTVLGVLVSQEQYIEYLELKQRSKERRYYINTYRTTNVKGSWVASDKYVIEVSCDDEMRKSISKWIEESVKKAEEDISAYIDNNKNKYDEQIESLKSYKEFLNKEIDDLFNKIKMLEAKPKSFFDLFK